MDTYRATNTLNGKFYIGSTNDFERRKKEHLKSKSKYPFQSALRKYPEAFEWEVWTDGFDEPILEQALLDMWFGTEQCYNLSSVVGRPGPEVNRESGKKSAKIKHSRKNSEGKSVAAVSMGQLGGRKTREGKLGCMGYTFEEMSERSKATHRKHPDLASRMGKVSAEKNAASKSKQVFCLDTGVTYPSISEASRQTGINPGTISRSCKREGEVRGGGLRWKFVRNVK
jgi:group I intron endonuclease